jgi:hypothetical protein
MIEPQLIIVYTTKIEKIYLLTINEDKNVYEKSRAYIYYENLKTKIKLEIIKSHIFLTYNIKTLKMFINTLLDIDYKYVMYSDEGNIEYSFVISELFNPFITSYEFNENNDVIYKNYPRCFNGLILYITDYIYLPNLYPDYTVIKDNNLLDFVNKMFKDYIDFEINHTYEKENFYLINITNSEILTILKNFDYKDPNLPKDSYENDYNITYIIKRLENYYIQGNSIKIYDFNQLLFNKATSLLIISKNETVVFATDGNKVFSEENDLFQYILKLIKKYRIERVSNKIIYNIKFNVTINPQMQISSFFGNILSETNSKNIYLTTDKQATIIFTKKKIIIKMINKIENLALYISELILYYSVIENKNKKNIMSHVHKKIGISYLSRICQNVENKIRKPFNIDKNEFDFNEYEKIKEDFYRNNSGEAYLENNIIYKCNEKDNLGRKYIGFIEKFYISNKLCIPCCYLFSKETDEIFNNCTSNYFEDIDNIINPYILTYNKVLTKNRLSFLYPALDKTFNKNSKIKIENNRIVYAKNFYCIYYYNNEIIENKDQIYNLIKNNNTFIFLKNIILSPFIDRYIKDLDINKPIKFFVLIQNILHLIVKINKEEDNDKIIIDDNVSDLYDFIKNYNSSINNKFKIQNSGLVYNENGFYIDGIKFTEKLTTNYLTSIPFIETNELINEDVNIDNIEINDLDFFIKTFNTNELLISHV